MKNKYLKYTGIMLGTSNLAFASGTSAKEPKIEDEKLEDKDEFKNILETLKEDTNKGVDSTQLTKDIFSKLYKCTKTENKKLKKNILNYSLNFGIKIEEIKDFFSGKIKIDKDKKNVIVLKKDPIFHLFQGTEKEILDDYKGLLNGECIILELNNDGVVNKLYNTTVDKDKKELSEKIKGKPQKKKKKPHNTKKIFDSVLSNNTIKNNKNINIIKLLNDSKLEFGLHESDKYNIELDGYIIIDVDKKDNNMLSTTILPNIEASIKSNISSISICGSGNKLSANDIIIAQKEINGKKILLIAKAEDVSKGKIGQQIIDSEFYESSLKEFFSKSFLFSDLDVNSKEIFNNIKDAFIKYKIDKGIYSLKSFDKNFQTLIKQWIIPVNKPKIDEKDLVITWNVLENLPKGIGICDGTGNFGRFKKNAEELKKYIINGSITTKMNLNENSILFVINGDKFMVADINDIATGTVNGQTIDDSFYKN